MNPVISYITARRNSRFDTWFLPALARQLQPDENPVVVKIDRYAKAPHTFQHGPITVHVHPPKPCVWSGEHRLTKEDWWSTSSYRNTALCVCPTEHIVYVDDLSIPSPNWWSAAKAAVHFPNTVTVGLYSKIRDLVVEAGVLTSYTQPASGIDRRLKLVTDPHGPCDHSWMFGCSLVAPIDALLDAGGWPEMADGLSFEDCLMSTVLGNRGVKFRYDTNLFTHEDEAAHHEEHPPMIRRDKGVSPNDKSHAALAIARQSRQFHNYFEGSTRGVRDYYRQHGEFPIVQIPDRDWYDGQLISEMTP